MRFFAHLLTRHWATAPDIVKFKGALKHLHVELVPLAVLVLGLLLTAGWAWTWNAAIEAQDQARFAHEADTLESLIGRRLNRVVNGLDEVRAVHAVAGRLDTADLKRYLANRTIGRDFPGMRGFGVIEQVRRPDVQEFERRQRASGNPSFTVRTSGDNQKADLFVVRSLEPAAQNLAAIGFDIGSIPAGRSAVQQAIDTGAATFTAPVKLLQDEHKGWGWVLYLPVYRGAPRSVEERREALEIVVLAPVVAREMLDKALSQLGLNVGFRLYDDADGERQLVFSTALKDDGGGGPASSRRMQVGGRTFVLEVTPGARPRSAADRLAIWGMAIVGVGLTLALAVLTRLLVSGRTQALVQADAMTKGFLRLADMVERTHNVVFATDAQGRLTWGNKGLEDLAGKPLNELIGRSPLAMLRMVSSGDTPAFRAVRDAVRAGNGRLVDVPGRRRDGERFWLEVLVEPEHAADGTIAGYSVIALDNTLRKVAELRLQAREHFLRTITDNLPARISYWNRDGRCLFGNLRFREVYGVKANDQQANEELCLPAALKTEPTQQERLVLQGMPQQFEQELVEADGRTSAWQVHYLPDFRGDEVHGYFVLASEITELKKARDVAVQASNAKTQFLATMSHEIRTPMTGVLGMVDLLLHDDLPPHVHRLVESIRLSGRHLLNVINDILDFSRLQSGRLQLEDTTFAIADLVEQVRSITTPIALERRLDFSFDIDPGLPRHLRGDATRLGQILLNLVGNAIKFTEHGSVATSIVQAAPADESGMLRVRFQVQDTGIGIAPEHQQDIFGAFTQADNSTSRKYGGSGLGLAISQQIVRAMGGEITVQSQVGAGSVFAFDIPVHPAQDPDSNYTVDAASAAAPRPLTVLVVEDVDVNRQILEIALTRAGNSVEFAHNGSEAVDLVRKRRFDVVLMDVQMPVMDGVEATRRIRRLGGEHASQPIIGLTANVMAHERQSYLAAGMDACLRKPIVWEELWAALGTYGARGAAAPAPVAPTDHAEPVLVAMDVIENLRKLAPGPALAKLLASTVITAEQCCAALDATDGGSSAAAHAHKLKGTAGTFGLLKLSALAARIEAGAVRGEDVQPLVQALRQALQDTRAELKALGLTSLSA